MARLLVASNRKYRYVQKNAILLSPCTIFCKDRLRFGKTFSNKFECFSLTLHYLCNMKEKQFSWRKRAKSFVYAFRGIVMLLRGEHNAWIHSAAAVTAVTLGLWLGLSALEWVAVAMCIGAVLAAEAFNSAIEVLSDRVSPGYDEAVRRTKDLAAGGVLLTAVAAFVAGLIVFVPKLIDLL